MFGITPRWQVAHAARPAWSVLWKISCWMLLKVGARLGDGPATSLNFSSQPLAPIDNMMTTAQTLLARTFIRLVLWDIGEAKAIGVPLRPGGNRAKSSRWRGRGLRGG